MKSLRNLLAALAVLALGAATQAQVAEKKTLTREGAKQVIAAAVAEAQKRNTTGVIAVVDDGGNLMAVERIDGTFGAGANISIGKARTAALFKRPTRVFEELINSSGKGRTAMTALNDFTPLIGGIPILLDGQIVGGVGVSGASSAAEDEELAIAGAKAVEGGMPMAMGPVVTYLESAKVSEAFAKGMPLLEPAGEHYKIHASRRDGPGMAEIHELDADLIYVLSGEATVVTGGRALDTKTIAPHEIRGAAIEGGETHKLVKGDVMVIPRNTPHWFKDVKAPFLYYVVKVN
ncbi:MAG: heme-binding protein [Acidobacteriales bacterium]|nr:heme-binding protein [Terriglobales bacterium]